MAHPLEFASLDFAQTPFLVIWEVTQACPLACRHCRASAELRRDPRELDTAAGKALLEACHGLGTPVVVLSGGDPLQRADLEELVAHGVSLGLRMATIPAATSSLTFERLRALRDAGLAQIAFSIDGPDAATHDGFRGVPGTFDRTLTAIGWARELGIPVQVNTTFSADNLARLPELVELVERLGIVFWEVFSLVSVGRGTALQPLDALGHERLFASLHELSTRVSFVIKVTEAPHYRRFILERRRRGHESQPHPSAPGHSGSAIPAQLSRELSAERSFGAKARGINAGKGFCFVSHTGDVFPSGFFPVAVGNVKEQPLASLYRDTELFQRLRDPSLLGGRCGVCEHADVCGGSRARALAATGDAFAEDPACSYIPLALRSSRAGAALEPS